MKFIFNNLNTIEDRFTQRIIWGNLWQMIRDNTLSPIWYLELVEKFSNIDHIKNQIEAKRDIYNNDRILKKVEIDNTFPNYILDNIEKFREFIV